MAESNFWMGTYASVSASNSEIHQANRAYQIELSDSVDFNPRIEVFAVRSSRLSIQVPRSSRYFKVKRIPESDFLQYFNRTLLTFEHLDIRAGEYYIDTDDDSECYRLEAFLEGPHIHLSLYINHGADMCDCKIGVSRAFGRRPKIRRDYRPLPESSFRQAFNLMLDFCRERDAYAQFQDALFAQVQALVCNNKPVAGLGSGAGRHFDKARAEMLKRRNSIELRLVSADDPPRKRRELRAEMKGIDFCISVLDANR